MDQEDRRPYVVWYKNRCRPITYDYYSALSRIKWSYVERYQRGLAPKALNKIVKKYYLLLKMYSFYYRNDSFFRYTGEDYESSVFEYLKSLEKRPYIKKNRRNDH